MGSHTYTANMNKISKNMRRAVRGIVWSGNLGLAQAGRDIRNVSQALAPVDLGNLKRSHFMVSAVGDNAGLIAMFDNGKNEAARLQSLHITAVSNALAQVSMSDKVIVAATTYYAGLVHSSNRQPKREFLKRAAELNHMNALSQVAKQVTKYLLRSAPHYRGKL